MRDDRRKASPALNLLSLGLCALLVAAASGCESDLFDDQINPLPPKRDDCYEEETWRCKEASLDLCRNGYWNPWYNCAWNGGTCEVSDETMGGNGHYNIGACLDPPKQQIKCELVDIWDTSDPEAPTDTDTDTSTDTSTNSDTDTDTGSDTGPDTDTGPWETFIPQACSICLTIPTDPLEFYYDGSYDTDTESDTDTNADSDTVEEPPDTDDHDTIHPVMPGGASNGVLGCCSVADGNAYWGEDIIVQQTCAKGCCAFIDYTSTKESPSPVEHRCCE